MAFKEFNKMVSSETLMYYQYLKTPLKVPIDASNKNLGAFINKDNKTVALFSRKLSKSHGKYTMK